MTYLPTCMLYYYGKNKRNVKFYRNYFILRKIMVCFSWGAILVTYINIYVDIKTFFFSLVKHTQIYLYKNESENSTTLKYESREFIIVLYGYNATTCWTFRARGTTGEFWPAARPPRSFDTLATLYIFLKLFTVHLNTQTR